MQLSRDQLHLPSLHFSLTVRRGNCSARPTRQIHPCSYPETCSTSFILISRSQRQGCSKKQLFSEDQEDKSLHELSTAQLHPTPFDLSVTVSEETTFQREQQNNSPSIHELSRAQLHLPSIDLSLTVSEEATVQRETIQSLHELSRVQPHLLFIL